MNNIKQHIFVVLVLLNTFVVSLQHRSRRFLTFPPTAPTRVQIISGIGIPVDLELESVTIGYVFKAEFFLPENASNYLNPLRDPFELSTQPISVFVRKRSIEEYDEDNENRDKNGTDSHRGYDSEQNERYETHLGEVEVVESGTEPPNQLDEIDDQDLWFQEEKYKKYDDPMAIKEPQNLGTSRWTVYKGMAALAESKGFSGKACVLRSICESAHAPFDYSNGILGEMMHVVMTPSTTHDELSEHSDSEYYRAEKLGREGVPCEHVFKECKSSILEQFTGIYTPIMDLLDKIIK